MIYFNSIILENVQGISLFKLENKKKLHTFYFVVSIILALTTYLYLKYSYYPYHLEIKKRYILESEVIQKIYFNDLDKNGDSERFELHYLKDIKRSMLLFYNSDDFLIEQFYLDGSVRKEGIHFADWDEDNSKDMVVLHVNNDTLYCDVIDVLEKRYLVKNLFVSIKDKRNNSKEWFYNSHILFDNRAERKLIYLSVSTAYGIYPRSIFLIDKEKLKVINRFDSTAPIEKAYLTDLNSDSIPEFVALTKATGNDFIKRGYHDFDSWLLRFDDSLKFYKNPKSINRFPGNSYLFQLNNELDRFLIFTDEISMPHIYAKLEKFDSDFNLKQTLLLKGGILFPAVDTISNRIYTSTKEGKISVYDFNFQLIDSLEINFSEINIVKKIFVTDIDMDKENEILVFTADHIRVYDKNFNLRTSRKLDYQYRTKDLIDEELTTTYNLGSETVLIIPEKSSVWVYRLVENYIITNLIYVFPITFLLYFLLIILFGKLISYFIRYISVFNYFLKVSDQGIMLLSISGKIKKINHRMIKLLILEEKNYIGKNFSDVFINNEEVLNQIEQSINYVQDSENDLTFRKGDNYFNGKVRVKIFKSVFDYPFAYLVEVKDFSKSLLEDRYKVWSRTSQKIAHDIKTPLSTIVLNLKAIQYRIDKEEIPNKEIYNEDLTLIQDELDRIKNLTRNFLKFTSSEKPNFSSIDISSIINKSLIQFQYYFDENIELKIEIKDNCNITADENQLEQLFHILIENAIDAIEGKGYLKIFAEEITDLTNNKSYCLIELTDNGIGITKEIMDKIYEPSFTTKVDGTGMGLAIGKKIIEDHNANIEFYSQNKLGTTVRLTFPLG